MLLPPLLLALLSVPTTASQVGVAVEEGGEGAGVLPAAGKGGNVAAADTGVVAGGPELCPGDELTAATVAHVTPPALVLPVL